MFAYRTKLASDNFFKKVMDAIDLKLEKEEETALSEILRPLANTLSTDYDSQWTTGKLLKIVSCANKYVSDETLEAAGKSEKAEDYRQQIQDKLAKTIASAVVQKLDQQNFESTEEPENRKKMIADLDLDKLKTMVQSHFEDAHFRGYIKKSPDPDAIFSGQNLFCR